MPYDANTSGKTGSAGVLDAGVEATLRRDRLRKLAMDSVDLSDDRYFQRDAAGRVSCKICHTAHKDEANYVAHLTGKRHQMSILRRGEHERRLEARNARVAEMLAKRADPQSAGSRLEASSSGPLIGRPGYRVVSSKLDEVTGLPSIVFEVTYPLPATDTASEEDVALRARAAAAIPLHRIVSPWSQRVEVPDAAVSYVVFAMYPEGLYEKVAFRIPNVPIDFSPSASYVLWDEEERRYVLHLTLNVPSNGLDFG